MSETIYYAYYSQDQQKYYFYNAITQGVSYEYPNDGAIYDPVTQLPWKMPSETSETQKTETPAEEVQPVEDNSASIQISEQTTPVKAEEIVPEKPIVEEKTEKAEISQVRSKKIEPSVELELAEEKPTEEGEPAKAQELSIPSKSGEKTVVKRKKDSEKTPERKKKRSSKPKEENPEKSSTMPPTGQSPVSSPSAQVRRSSQIATVSPMHNRTRSSTVAMSKSATAPILDIPDMVANYVPSVQAAIPAPKRAFMPGEEDLAPNLPTELQNDIHKFRIEEYAHKFFREHRSKQLFNRKQLSVEALTTFTRDPIEAPLLKELSPVDSKSAIKIFQAILSYTGVIQTRTPAVHADRIVAQLHETPILRDETFFQLIKQTRECPDSEILIRTWNLFLIVATFFPSSLNSEIYIKSHLSEHSRSKIPSVATISQFTYIRFCARCAAGKPLNTNEIGYVQKIPRHPAELRQRFGASIYEMLWNQNNDYPNLPIPISGHEMCEALIAKGGETEDGIFRHPGNLRKVADYAETLNKSNIKYDSIDMKDLASLIKRWYREFPDPVVPFDTLGNFLNANEDGTFLDFADSLPRAHRLTLKYLIGFLRRIASHSAENRMVPGNLAICFAPNLVQLHDNADPGQIKKYSEVSIAFITQLINEWDVSEIYPLPEEMLQVNMN